MALYPGPWWQRGTLAFFESTVGDNLSLGSLSLIYQPSCQVLLEHNCVCSFRYHLSFFLPSFCFLRQGFRCNFRACPGAHFVDWFVLKLTKILLPLLTKCWDERCVPQLPSSPVVIFKAINTAVSWSFSRNYLSSHPHIYYTTSL